MIDAEQQRRARQKKPNVGGRAVAELALRDAAINEQAKEIAKLRKALRKICDITSERMRTKAEMQCAVDQIGILSATALVRD